MAAFMAVLDRYTLEDMLARRVDMLSLFAGSAALTAAGEIAGDVI
jgi:hypothetical protein